MRLTRVLIVAFGLMLIAASASFASTPFLDTGSSNQMAPTAETGQAGNVFMTALTTGTIPGGEIISIAYSPATVSSVSFLTVSLSLAGNVYTMSPTTWYASTVPQAIAQSSISGVVTAGAVSVTTTVYTNYIVLAFVNTPPEGDSCGTGILSNCVVNFLSGDYILINGVRVNVNQANVAVGGILQANISSALGQATLLPPQVQVANYQNPFNVFLGPYAPAFYQNGVAYGFDTVGAAPPTEDYQTVIISEAGSFTDAFETQCQEPNNPVVFNSSTVCATQLVLTIANVPTGLVFAGASPTVTGLAAPPGAITPEAFAVNTAPNQVTVYIYAQNTNAIDSFTVTLYFRSTGVTIPLNQPAATVTVTLGPPASTPPPFTLGDGLPLNTGAPIGPDLYSVAPSPPLNIPITITPLFTTLLATFNVYSADFATTPPTGYATGFAVLNGSATILLPLSITAAAVPHDYQQPGTITVYLYPANQVGNNPPVYYSFTTGTGVTPGNGLNALGQLPAGGTWTVLLESLLTAASYPAGAVFEGTVIFVCNFPDGSGVNYIADPDFSVNSQGYQMIDVFGTGLDQNGECIFSNPRLCAQVP